MRLLHFFVERQTTIFHYPFTQACSIIGHHGKHSWRIYLKECFGFASFSNSYTVFGPKKSKGKRYPSREIATIIVQMGHSLYLLDAVLLYEYMGGIEIRHHARQPRVQTQNELLRGHIAARQQRRQSSEE